ncbi:acetyl esterase/lipase [Haloferula luteola]|uniref:Acetyl esterase/lipase n=1 Tax=Haloferula luteola TaxID=595692 RepID=A0A840UYG5_9BACT|nr:alpha/beta hydrolase [Haloferula luteola]MBB5349866.1 acetyl esterase/lipase [Haloferula luteola]
MSVLFRVPPIGQARQKEMMKSAISFAYKETEQGPLSGHFFLPEGHQEGDERTLVLFFHGGFWDSPMITQFVPQCLHFASRGAIAGVIETRLQGVHGTGPMEAIEDVDAFFAWLREKSEEVRLKLDRLVLGGTAGGAFLALDQALRVPGKDKTSSVENPPAKALILYSALVNTTAPEIAARFPQDGLAKKFNPLRRPRRHAPPMIFFHGRRDRLTPFPALAKFARKMKWRKNQVEIVDYEKAEHSFFNFNVSEFYFELTTKAADHFLVDLGLLEPNPFDDVV